MAHVRVTLLKILVVVLLTLPLAAPSSAVPMWSRRYGVECSTCHSYPSLQLTGTGLDFFRRGHRFGSNDAKSGFADYLSSHGEWEYSVQKGEATSFPAPELHLHAGGALTSLFSAYADANVNSDFEALYLQITKSVGKHGFVTARQGKLSPSILREYSNGLLASASTPVIITDATLGSNPFTPVRDSYGLDVAGRWRMLFAQTGIVNGDEIPGQVLVGTHKDVFATIEVNGDDNPSGVGVYYYHGGYDLADSASGLGFDSYHREAVFANFTRDRYRFTGAYLTGKDRIDLVPDRKISGYYVQADGVAREWAVPFARYDWVKTETGEEDIVKQGTMGVSLRIFSSSENAGRVVLEVTRRKEGDISSTIGLVNLLWAI